MANTKFYVEQGVLPATATTVDITVGAELSRSPTGAIVFISYATALDTDTSDTGLSVGVTDFTTTECYTYNAEDGQSTTDTNYDKGVTGDIGLMLTPGTKTAIRTVTAAAITSGIRLTTGEAGTQFRVWVMLVFGSACSAHLAGNTTVANSTYNLAHGFTNAPKCGFFFGGEGSSAHMNPSFGLMSFISSTIKQRAFSFTDLSAQSTTSHVSTREVYTDRVFYDHQRNFDGTEEYSIEVTTVDSTNVTCTTRTGTQLSDVLALIVECDDVDVFLDTVDSPTTAASDWDYTGAPWQPQFAVGLLNLSDSEAAGGNTLWGTPLGGGFGMTAFDAESTILTLGTHSEENVATSNEDSRLSQALYLHLDTGSVAHDMNNHSFTATGFSFAAADITSANGTIRKWPMLFVEEAATGAGAAYHRRLLGT